MKPTKLTRALLLLLLPALLLSGCWQDNPASETLQPAASSQEEGDSSAQSLSLPKTFSLPYLSNTTLDPITCPDGVQQTVGALLYEGLYELDEKLEPVPRLCASASCDAAALIWSFTVRAGVTFADGSPLTAADAAATLRRAMASTRYAARLACIKAVSASDSTLTVTLTAANGDLPSLLDIPIVKSGTENSTVPTGTGPYRFITDESGVYLGANTGWWGGKALPVQRVELVACSTEDAARYQFTSHDVQLLCVDQAGANPLSAAGGFEFCDADTTVLQYVGLNLKRPLLASAAVRRALNLGIDREAVAGAYLSSHARAAQFPISPVCAEYPSDLESKYSLIAYQTAIQSAVSTSAAGSARRITLIVNGENSFKVSAAKYIAAALSTSVLTVEVSVLPWEDYTAALAAGNFDLYYGEVRLTADWDLRPLLGTGGALNYGGYSDPTADLLLTNFTAASQNRAAAAKTLCSYLTSQPPILPVCFRSVSVLFQQNVVESLTPTAANPFYDIGGCSIRLAG